MGSSLYVHNKYSIPACFFLARFPLAIFARIFIMQTLEALQQSSEIRHLLTEATSIAIVGLSPKETRPSYMVGRYLLEAGYTIYPVNPGQTEILGEICYPDLESIPNKIDIVDIFRKSEDILPIVEQVVKLKSLPLSIWMQQGIVNESAAELARSKGMYVIMDRCIKVDHSNLLRK
jgi:predicted CoA-binding protein